MKLLYVIGDPGSGKSTVVQHLTRRCPSKVLHVPYVAWTSYGRRTCQLGYQRENFSGTDALGLASQKYVIAWLLKQRKYDYVLAEGDRLANGKFFTAMMAAGVDVTVVTLLVKQRELDKRRTARNEVIGHSQNPQWLASRSTKTVNLWTEWGTPEWTIDTTKMSVGEVAAKLAKHPVGRQFARIRKGASDG